MKKLLLCLLLTSLGSIVLVAQRSPWEIQVNYGLSATLHYNFPLQKNYCREGCPTEEQNPGLAHAFSAGISRRLAERHSVYLMMGYSELRFHESGPIPFSSLFPTPHYSVNAHFQFTNLQLGHILRLKKWDRYELVLSNSLLAEHTIAESYSLSQRYLNRNNFSYLGKIGMVLDLGKAVALNTNFTFRTALSSYNRQYDFDYFDDYKPFGMGIETGLRIRL